MSLLALLSLVPGFAGCRAQQPWPLWQAYTQRFLDAQGRVIDRSVRDRTTSEGQAYSMFFALVDNDRPHFDTLLHWTETNLAGGDLTGRLPAWEWGHADSGEWTILDDNSAADADLWLAYDLLEAGRLWHEPRYEALGRSLAERIAHEEVVLVPGAGTTLAPGAHGFKTGTSSWVLNPSYLPLSVLTGLATRLHGGPWGSVAASLPALLSHEAGAGFAMDWLEAGEGGLHAAKPPADAAPGRRESEPAGSYDAIRVYLWLGMADVKTPLRAAALSQLSGMTETLRATGAPPLEIDAHGRVVQAQASIGFTAAVVPFMEAAGLNAQASAARLRVAGARDAGTGLYGQPATYYDQNLVLFSTGFVEHRFRFERDGTLLVSWK